MKIMKTLPVILLLMLMMSYTTLLAATTQSGTQKIETSIEETSADESVIDVENAGQSPQIIDSNENAEVLKVYQNSMDRVRDSKKNMLFGEKVNTGGLPIISWLEQEETPLLELAKKYPESRHAAEGLGLLYKELHERTQNEKYAEKAADMFIQAEKFGIKSGLVGLPQYAQELSSLGTQSQLDKYFTMAMNVYPDNGHLDLQYAKGLARFKNSRADEFFKQAISKRDMGDFQPLTSYAEDLFDKGKYQKALEVLQQWSDSEGYAFYLHFLKGFALEKLGRLKEAQEEYQQFQNAQTGTTPEVTQLLKSFLQIPSKYRIPGSELQKGLPFKTESKGAIRTSSDTFSRKAVGDIL